MGLLQRKFTLEPPQVQVPVRQQNDSDQTEENIEETKNEGQRLWQVPS